MTALILQILHPFKYPGLIVMSTVFQIDEKFIHQLSAMFTCRDGKGGKLSSQVSKMIYKPPSVVYIASYKGSLNQLDC